MYLLSMKMDNFRSFKSETIHYRHPDQDEGDWANINLLLGANGSGKTSILQAIAIGLLAELMPRFNPRYLIRREEEELAAEQANITLTLQQHLQDGGKGNIARTAQIVPGRGIFASAQAGDQDIFQEDTPSFFLLGYGSTRWVPTAGQYDIPEARNQKNHVRYQRVASLFEDNFGLMPLEAWLPKLAHENPFAFGQVGDLLKNLLPEDISRIRLLSSPVLFQSPNGALLPLSALSDGYRSYFAWICDLLYHLAMASPAQQPFSEMKGVVLLDEIDLHLHPSWQLHVLRTLNKHLPNLQIILTSHSPLVAGTLPAQNIFLMALDEDGLPKVVHPDREIRGLDADQILINPVFGLESTRTPDYHDEHEALYRKAVQGDTDAVLAIMDLQAKGLPKNKSA